MVSGSEGAPPGGRARSVDEVVELFDRFGEDGYDEHVSQLAHALQTAALAEAAGAAPPLVAAALLHDVGHLRDLEALSTSARRIDASTDLRHEDTGSSWLRPLFPPAVTAPIALHVAAKRYLCAVDPGYHARLSPASVHSLALQGGPMDRDEAVAFEARPGWQDAVALRRWDDAAKVEGLAVPGLDDYREMLDELAMLD